MADYKWKRFWCPRDGKINLGDDGYLYDLDSASYRYHENAYLVTFQEIADVPCLVLLGEPGIGKSRVLDEAHTQTTNSSLHFELGEYGSDTELCNDIFKHEVVQNWQEGTNKLELFIDSLDEGLLSIPVLTRILKRKLENLPCSRLKLRITCRTADWPNSLEEKLKELWGKDEVKVYELAPLRRIDVVEAANTNQIDADAFLQEIYAKNAVPLAFKPITLKFLLDLCKQGQQLPSTQKELYEKGCLWLCEEHNRDRLEAGHKGKFKAEERIRIAGRIAAVTLFARKAAVRTNIDDVGESSIQVRELYGKEKFTDSELLITEEAIEEVFSITQLFRSANGMAFVHQTYSEFLAAWYLNEHNVPLTQLKSLFFSPGDSENKLIPQLHETAAWLASMKRDFLEEVMKSDPDVLLKSDVTTEDSVREAIVENLLCLLEDKKLFNKDLNYRKYERLKHGQLASQLRPYVKDYRENNNVRYEAICIAEICKLQELQEDLVNLVLNSSEPIYLRSNAACALSSIGDRETKMKLKGLAFNELEEDEHESIKGWCWSAIWPDTITAAELFENLSVPKINHNYPSIYEVFLERKLAEHLQKDDILLALNWLEEEGFHHKFRGAASSIIIKAWEYLNELGVLTSFAKIAAKRWQESRDIVIGRYENQLRNLIFKDAPKRRSLIEKVVKFIAQENEYSKHKVSYLKTKITLETDEIINITESNEIFKERFSNYLGSVDIDSESAKKQKASYEEMLSKSGYEDNINFLKLPSQEKIRLLLNKIESGEILLWRSLIEEINNKEDGQLENLSQQVDITSFPNGQKIDDITQKRIVQAAKKFTSRFSPSLWRFYNYLLNVEVLLCFLKKLSKNIKTSYYLIREINKLLSVDLTSYRYKIYLLEQLDYTTIKLILREESSIVKQRTRKIWRKWESAFSSCLPNQSDNCEIDTKQINLELEDINNRIFETLDFKTAQHISASSYRFIINKIDSIWNDNIADLLLSLAAYQDTKPEIVEQLLTKLLRHEFSKAEDFAKSLIKDEYDINSQDYQKSIIAAKELIKRTKDGWSLIRPKIEKNINWGREVIGKVAIFEGFSANLKLNEVQLADFYIWLVHQYPHHEDPGYKKVDTECSSRATKVLRDSILEQLKQYGTYKACKQIQRISQELPQMKGFYKVHLTAQEITRRKSWKPLQLSEILKLISDSNKRIIQDGNQLLDVLIESLENLQTNLKGETPMAKFLWNEVDKKVYKPKDENDLSDYIKNHLDKDFSLQHQGIFINREVEIRRGGTGGLPGERTDLHVDAIIRDLDGNITDQITVIIEVKGCWHPDLNDAMKDQLVNRYLKDNTCQHGLYLVGWFNCQQWDKDDYRKRQAPKIPVEQAKTEFNEQAEGLSSSNTGMQIKAFVLDTALH